ncbi:MAG: MBL fold metallo-hydrolase [Candidatus Rariloculaceae bacterium]
MLLATAIGLVVTPSLAQPPGMGARNWDNFEIAAPQHVAGNIYNVVGGIIVNIAISVGDDGIILVDSNFAALTEKILASIREISDEPIRFVIDTHDHADHADHADGNVNFGRAGAVILVHDSVRARLANPPQGPSAPSVALPIVTFAESVSLHVNGEDVEAIHVAAGHTDGDVLIFFRGSDVIYMGDVFVGQYPISDVTRGGSYAGFIETLDRAVALIGPDTLVIPGHGPISGRNDMIDYRNMLRDIYA